MKQALARLGILFVMFALAACATATAPKPKSIAWTLSQKRIVLIEPYFKLISDKNLFEKYHYDWTQSAKLLFAKHLEQRLAPQGIELVVPDPGSVPNDMDVSDEPPLAVLLSSRTEDKKLPCLTGPLPVPQWTPGLANILGSHYEADYALFVHVEDAYAGPTTVALGLVLLPLALLVCSQGGGCNKKSPPSACAELVDLHSGNIVWSNIISQDQGGFREDPSAQNALQFLLANSPL